MNAKADSLMQTLPPNTAYKLAMTSAVVSALLLILGMPWSGPAELMLLGGFFVVAFSISSLLFRRVARG